MQVMRRGCIPGDGSCICWLNREAALSEYGQRRCWHFACQDLECQGAGKSQPCHELVYTTWGLPTACTCR